MSNFRLRTDSSFFRTAQRYVSSIGMIYVRSVEPSAAGLAIIAPKKHFPRSVDRHRVKRRLRAVLRVYSLPAHIVVVAQRAAQTASFVELTDQVARVLGPAKV